MVAYVQVRLQKQKQEDFQRPGLIMYIYAEVGVMC